MTFLRNTILIVFITILAGSAAMAGITGTFVKADAVNTGPMDAIDGAAGAGFDLKWAVETWGSVTAITSHANFVEGVEDCPVITTTVGGLDPTKSYDVYVQFLGHLQGNWAVYANLPGNGKKLLTVGNSVKTGLMWDGVNPICESKLGNVSGVSSFSVEVDDYADSATFSMSNYYGVSYKEVPVRTPGFSGTFVKADTSNTTPVDAVSGGVFDGYDGKWSMESDGTVTSLTSYAYFGDGTEDCPAITTTVGGLDPNKTYAIYADALIHSAGVWGIYANLPGQAKRLLINNTTTPTGLTWDGSNPISECELGVVSGVSSFSVVVDDYINAPFSRSHYYGVSYKEVPAGTKFGGINGTFVKADATNTTPTDAINGNPVDGYDAKWSMETRGNLSALFSYAKFDPANGVGEDCPQLTTTINGLDATRTYDIYVVYFSGYGGNWSMYANLAGQPKEYCYIGNSIDTLTTFDGTNPICEYKLGTVSGATSFAINADDFSNSSAYALSSYYGVSYEDVTPAPPAPVAPIVGINNKAINDTIITAASANYQFKVWGKVSIISSDSFSLDDGSGIPVTVVAPGYTGIADGNYATAVGTLSDAAGNRVLNAYASNVVKVNN